MLRSIFLTLAIVLLTKADTSPYVQIHELVDTKLKHDAYNELAYIVDTFGPRVWGSISLDRAIAHIVDYLEIQGLSPRLEPVRNTPIWQRGAESLYLLEPSKIPRKLNLIGLGKGFPGIANGEALIFETYAEFLATTEEQISGRIVVIAEKWVEYEHNVQARNEGPAEASKRGAIGFLIRSVATSSIDSPHTGITHFGDTPGIPAAAISVETAEMLVRMKHRRDKIKLKLEIHATLSQKTKTTYNIVAEIKGSEKPEEIVLFGGHTDSWDTGSQTGANDDGGGFMVCLQAIRAIKKLKLQPKRTLRFIAWVGEEFGDGLYSGNVQYLKAHESEIFNHFATFESDYGTKKFVGLGYSSKYSEDKEKVKKMLQKVTDNVNGQDYTYVLRELDEFAMVDVTPLWKLGVPALYNVIAEDDDSPYQYPYYYRYHHSAGDSMTMLDADDLDSNVKGIASFMYALANY